MSAAGSSLSWVGRVIWLFLTLILLFLIASFASSNQDIIQLGIWPFDGQLSLPVWVAVSSALAIGTLFGAFMFWLSVLRLRARLWQEERKLTQIKKKLAALEGVEEETERDAG